MIEIRTATSDDLEEILAVDARNFAYDPEPDDLERSAQLLDMDRFLVAVDTARQRSDIVGIAGTFEKTLTLPGLAQLPMAGVTWVSVSASHRRQGVLTQLMSGLDEQAATRNEPILGLMASEGAIYERFGFGIATLIRSIELDRRRARLREEFRPAPGSIRLIEPRDHVGDLLAVFDRYHLAHPGSVSRNEPAFREMHFSSKKTKYAALHQDGFAIWRIESDWAHGQPNHRLILDDLIAVTEDAAVALWHTILSIDLVGPIGGWNVIGLDDPLPYLLDDPRAARTDDLNDHLWLKVADPVTCFQHRPLATDDEFVMRIVDSMIAEPEPGSATATPGETVLIGPQRAEPTDRAPDIELTRSALGSLLMGGVPSSTLAAGRRLRASADTLRRADRAFAVFPRPICRTGF